MGKTILIVLVTGIGALLLFAASKPDNFGVQRSANIQATPEKLHALINDLHQFNTWNPYNLKDPNVKIFYRGPVSGPGAAFDFNGNKDVGKGSIQITASRSDQVDMELHMIEPMEGRNAIEFKLLPQGDGTQVTWAMHGQASFMYKLASIFINMDQMLGRDFEAGLGHLKAKAEGAKP